MNLKRMRRKIIIIFLIVAMLIPYIPVYTPTVEASSYDKTFSYTGGIQSYAVQATGLYKLEVWGAQGGAQPYNGQNSDNRYGYGGYSYGYIELKSGQTLYIAVGGQGSVTSGGYNGGGSPGYHNSDDGGGGGATHIATSNRGVLSNYSSNQSEVLIVAGGGGGGRSLWLSLPRRRRWWRYNW